VEVFGTLLRFIHSSPSPLITTVPRFSNFFLLPALLDILPLRGVVKYTHRGNWLYSRKARSGNFPLSQNTGDLFHQRRKFPNCTKANRRFPTLRKQAWENIIWPFSESRRHVSKRTLYTYTSFKVHQHKSVHSWIFLAEDVKHWEEIFCQHL